MAGEDEVGAGGVQRLPQRPRLTRPATLLGGQRAEQRVMPEGQRAVAAVPREVARQPPLLGRALVAAAGHGGARRVQGDDVPRAELEAVVATPGAVAGAAAPHAGAVEVV